MELKRKLVTSFMLVVVIPLIMVLVMGKVILSYQLKSIERSFDLEMDTVQIISNPMQLLNQITRGVYNKVVYQAEHTPEQLEDLNFIRSLNDELDAQYSFLAVRKDNSFIFSGNADLTERIQSRLPRYGEYHTNIDGGIYISGKTPVLIKQQDFIYTDGAKGSIFVITDVSRMVPQIRASAIQAVVSFACILILTALVLSGWLYGSIVRPLNKLKTATKKMKEGNLDFTISGNSEDEIGQLCEDFEEMRAHLKELLEVRIRYEQETRELISNISHDLKTPLTAIKGYTEGIIDGVADTPERMDKYIRTIYNKANDMSVLVDELALYSKIDSNEIPYNFVPLKISAYFDDCVEELKLDMEVREIALCYENLVAPDVRVLVDVEQLKRVITNIVSNSVKYTDRKSISDEKKRMEPGRICIRLTEREDLVIVEIQDNGSGIPAEDLPHIFERFYRADAARGTKHGGSGLGLAIAQKIIEDHDGRIWAESTLGEGTTITIELRKLSETGQNIDTEEENPAAAVKRFKRLRNFMHPELDEKTKTYEIKE